MQNPFPYSLDNKRYHTYNYYLKKRYHQKVAKIGLDAGFTCPNRDGKVGVGGCIYCSGDFVRQPSGTDLIRQLTAGCEIMRHKWPQCLFIAYFQSGSNTYGSLKRLQQCFEPFVGQRDIVGLSIATRPDCLSEEVLDYLEDLARRTDLTIELGLQTIHEKTAQLINRGHDLACFEEAVIQLRKRKIDIAVHIINGLPYETPADMIATARYVAKLDIQFLKIHMLYILENTPLYQMYQSQPFPLLSREDYIQLVVDQLEYLPENVVIERLTGDGDASRLFYPLWSIKKVTILNDIDKEFLRRNTWQGKKATP